MNFNDIFKNSFLENTVQFSVVDTLISLVLAYALGMFIYFIYKKTYQGVVFSRSFGVSLIALTMISTFIILFSCLKKIGTSTIICRLRYPFCLGYLI